MAKQRITPYGVIHEAESDHQYVSAYGTTFDETGSLTLRIKPAAAIAGTSCAEGPLINGKRYVLADPAIAGTFCYNDVIQGTTKYVKPDPAAAGTYANAVCPSILWVKPSPAYSLTECEFTFLIQKLSGEGSAKFHKLLISGSFITGLTGYMVARMRPLELESGGWCEMLLAGELELEPLEMSSTNLTGESGQGSAVFHRAEISGDNWTATGKGSAVFRLPVLNAAGLSGVVLNADLELPFPVAFGYGPGIYDGQMSADLVMVAAQADAWLATGQVAEGVLQFQRLILHADQLGLNYEGSGSAVFPALLISANVVENVILVGACIMSALDAAGMGYADMLADIATGFAIVSTAAMNNANGAVCDWEWQFNSFGVAAGFCYAGSSDGIYILDGPSDNGDAIPCDVCKLEMDFRSPLLKRATDAYVRLRSDDVYDFTILADGIPCVLPVNDDLDGIHGKKVNLPRGLKGRRLGVSISNTSGADITLEKLDLQVEVLSRRGRTQNA